MKKDVTSNLVEEHKLILRMLAILEVNATLTGAGAFRDYGFYLVAVGFIRLYADRFHHAKEEDILFEALIENGMPRANSPVAAMMMEHDCGRAFVKAMEEAAQQALAGDRTQDRIIEENAIGYVNLLREHIDKEDNILYPLSERVLPAEVRDGILDAYAKAQAKSPAGFENEYRVLVAQYEAQALERAA